MPKSWLRIHWRAGMSRKSILMSNFRESKQNFQKLLARQLPDHAFHLQIKERSQNLRGVQPGLFHDVVNMPRLVGTQQVVDLLLRRVQRRRQQQVPLLGFRLFRLYQRRADWSRKLLDHILPVGNQLGPLLDQLVRREAHWLGHVARNSEYLPAEFHC
jgi:hypothetical protein